MVVVVNACSFVTCGLIACSLAAVLPHLMRTCCTSGADQRQCHRIGGCRRLLSRLERHRLDCERGECPSLDTTARPDNAAEHNGHPTSAWDTQRAHDHFGNDAGEWMRVYRCGMVGCTMYPSVEMMMRYTSSAGKAPRADLGYKLNNCWIDERIVNLIVNTVCLFLCVFTLLMMAATRLGDKH